MQRGLESRQQASTAPSSHHFCLGRLATTLGLFIISVREGPGPVLSLKNSVSIRDIPDHTTFKRTMCMYTL